MLVLAAASDIEADAFVAESVSSFIDELVATGVERGAASAATYDFVHRLLPDGVRTEGHRFRWIEVVDRRIGRLWSGPLPESSGDYYLFEIDIDEDERGQSLGREAIKVMIGELERENVGRFGLSVFDSNTAAVTLYESLGFETRRDVDGQREMWLNLRQPR